jgi:hypothetical protein
VYETTEKIMFCRKKQNGPVLFLRCFVHPRFFVVEQYGLRSTASWWSKDLTWAHISRRQTHYICYIKRGVNPGFNPGFCVLRCGFCYFQIHFRNGLSPLIRGPARRMVLILKTGGRKSFFLKLIYYNIGVKLTLLN